MSINTLCDIAYSGSDNESIATLKYLLGQIDYNKLCQRVKYAREFPDNDVKCVLLEYTSYKYDNRFTGPRYAVVIPGTHLEINWAFNRRKFHDLANKHLLNNICGLNLYTRQKIGKNGVPVANRRQLVLKIEAGALEVQPQPMLENEVSDIPEYPDYDE
jgi:hypothetical protein